MASEVDWLPARWEVCMACATTNAARNTPTGTAMSAATNAQNMETPLIRVKALGMGPAGELW